MTEELKEVIEDIESINADLADQLQSTRYHMWSTVTVEVNGTDIRASIAGVTLWQNEDDPREVVEMSKSVYTDQHWYKPEPMEPYLRKKINELVQSLNKIKL